MSKSQLEIGGVICSDMYAAVEECLLKESDWLSNSIYVICMNKLFMDYFLFNIFLCFSFALSEILLAMIDKPIDNLRRCESEWRINWATPIMQWNPVVGLDAS